MFLKRKCGCLIIYLRVTEVFSKTRRVSKHPFYQRHSLTLKLFTHWVFFFLVLLDNLAMFFSNVFTSSMTDRMKVLWNLRNKSFECSEIICKILSQEYLKNSHFPKHIFEKDRGRNKNEAQPEGGGSNRIASLPIHVRCKREPRKDIGVDHENGEPQQHAPKHRDERELQVQQRMFIAGLRTRSNVIRLRVQPILASPSSSSLI